MHEGITDKFQWSQYNLKYEPIPCKIVTKSAESLAIPSWLKSLQKKKLILQQHLRKNM